MDEESRDRTDAPSVFLESILVSLRGGVMVVEREPVVQARTDHATST